MYTKQRHYLYLYSMDRLPFRGCKCKVPQLSFLLVREHISLKSRFKCILIPDRGNNLYFGFQQVPGNQSVVTQKTKQRISLQKEKQWALAYWLMPGFSWTNTLPFSSTSLPLCPSFQMSALDSNSNLSAALLLDCNCMLSGEEQLM